MRNALLAVVAVVAAVVAAGSSTTSSSVATLRNTSIAGVDVGRLDIDEAAELLTDGRLTDRRSSCGTARTPSPSPPPSSV